MRFRVFAAAVFLLCGVTAVSAQTPVPPAPSPTPTPAPLDTRALLDQLGGCVEGGKLHVEIDLVDGQFPVAKGYILETTGSPGAALLADAAGGKVTRMEATVSRGRLLVNGKGLRPKVYVEGFAFEDGKGITQLKVRGKGIWRPIVGIFKGLAMRAVKKLHINTEIPALLRGEILGKSQAASGKPPAGPTPIPAAMPAAAPGPSFLDLVGEVRVKESELVAFPAKPLVFGEMARFQTAAQPKNGVPLKVAVDEGLFRPGRGGGPSTIDLKGRLDGEVEEGAVAFGNSHSTFSRGELVGGRFRFATAETGAVQTEFGARSFTLELTDGDFHLPGGPEVDVEAPSRIAFRDLAVKPDSSYSALVDADLKGKVGRITRGLSKFSASGIRVRTESLRVVDNRADGDVDLECTYRIDYTLVVKYPMKEVGEKKELLRFEGPFTSRLHFEKAGKDTGAVTGDYAFKVPWPPIETVALEVLKAKWNQDVTPAMKRVDFDIQPRRFAPCGEQCFVLELGVTAEKKQGAKKRLFRQICEPEGKAELVIDSETRSFLLKNVRIEPRCKGVVGWIVNFLTPLLTKTYSDVKLFQMPENLPFTIEKVDSGVNWLAISGKVEWEAKASPSQ